MLRPDLSHRGLRLPELWRRQRRYGLTPQGLPLQLPLSQELKLLSHLPYCAGIHPAAGLLQLQSTCLHSLGRATQEDVAVGLLGLLEAETPPYQETLKEAGPHVDHDSFDLFKSLQEGVKIKAQCIGQQRRTLAMRNDFSTLICRVRSPPSFRR